MKLIKLAFISVLVIFLIATAFSLLIPSHVRISKAINLRAPGDSVLSLVRSTANWQRWHPAFQGENPARFRPIDIKTTSDSDSEVVMRLQQGGKEPVVNGWKLYSYEGIDSITLQWYMDFQLKWYPWKKFGSLFYENTYGLMMQQGLENIKNELQASRPEPRN